MQPLGGSRLFLKSGHSTFESSLRLFQRNVSEKSTGPASENTKQLPNSSTDLQGLLKLTTRSITLFLISCVKVLYLKNERKKFGSLIIKTSRIVVIQLQGVSK